MGAGSRAGQKRGAVAAKGHTLAALQPIRYVTAQCHATCLAV